MTTAFRRWCETRRYQTTLRALRALSARELGELMIPAEEISRLAREASRL